MKTKQKDTLRNEDHLRALTYTSKPVLMPDGSVIYPDNPKVKADLSHIALGLWAGYIFVLFCPGRKGSPNLSEKHLMQAYGGMMNIFGILMLLLTFLQV